MSLRDFWAPMPPSSSGRVGWWLSLAIVPMWLALIVYSGLEMAHGVKDAYPGEHSGFMYLCVGSLAGSIGPLIRDSRLRAGLGALSLALVIASLHYIVQR
jgi:hypothetical protein